MTAFWPSSARVAWMLAACPPLTLLVGLVLTRLRPSPIARAVAWAVAVGAVVAVERLAAGEPAGLRMLALIGVLLYAMKAVVSLEVAAAGGVRLGPLRWLAFAALWPGMRPELFATLGGPARDGAGRLLVSGIVRLTFGAALIAGAHVGWQATGSRLLLTVLGLPGISLVLHFGLFDLTAGAWRLLGVDARKLFVAPLAATRLGEFWGRRWNLPFTEMTQRAVYRPLARRVGRGPAALAGFAFSGLLHELAISVPVRAGHGLPTLYFVIHGVLILIERRAHRARRPIDRPAWRGHLWTLAWLAVPMPILFHRPFLREIVWPLLGAC